MRMLLEYVVVVVAVIGLVSLIVNPVFDINVYDILRRKVREATGQGGFEEVWSVTMRRYRTKDRASGEARTVERLAIESGEFSATVVIHNGDINDFLNVLDTFFRRERHFMISNPFARQEQGGRE